MTKEQAQLPDEPASLVTKEALPVESSGRDRSVEALLQIAIERGLDPDGLEKLVALHERVEARRAEQEFNAALLAFQNACPVIHKNKPGHGYNFTSFDYLVSTIRPHLDRHGLSFSFDVDPESPAEMIRLKTIIRHTGGHRSESVGPLFPVAPVTTKMSAPQGVGGASSYAKRYGLLQALGIATGEDDDAAHDLEFIDEEQTATLDALIEECGADRDRFLKHMNIDQLGHMPKREYPRAVHLLNAKRRQG